jgi:hypothetical protein
VNLTQWGLLLNFVGSALVGLSAYVGYISGFGALVWKPRWMVGVFWGGVAFIEEMIAFTWMEPRRDNCEFSLFRCFSVRTWLECLS